MHKTNMQYILAASLLIAAANCAFGQDICPLYYSPLCGSDGKTYSNKCFFQVAQKTNSDLSMKHLGACTTKRAADDEKINFCTLEYSPLCGSDGKTYSNKCFFQVAQKSNSDLTMNHLGACKTKRDVIDEESDDDCPEYSKNGICTLEYFPVCASNGQTYSNKCGMCVAMYNERKEGKQANFRVMHPGKCGSLDYCLPRDKSGACTYEYMPICGSDGVTYPNRCTFCFSKSQKEAKGEEMSMEYVGECLNCPAMSKQGACPRNYAPVCASDGKTYGNLCMLCAEKYRQHNQGTGMGLRMQHEGVCKFEATLYSAEFCRPEWKSGMCTREYNPICGTDGVSYGNPCTFCYAMFEKQAKGNDISVRREGPCKDEDKLVCPKSVENGICTMEYSPVCGSDGIVYPNKCFFCVAQKEKLKNGVELYFHHVGKCYV